MDFYLENFIYLFFKPGNKILGLEKMKTRNILYSVPYFMFLGHISKNDNVKLFCVDWDVLGDWNNCSKKCNFGLN